MRKWDELLAADVPIAVREILATDSVRGVLVLSESILIVNRENIITQIT